MHEFLWVVQLRAKMLELEKQLGDSKKDSQQMVAALQQTMSEKVTDLREELTDAQLQCQRMIAWGVRSMCSRRDACLLQACWEAWKELACLGLHSQDRECKVQLLVARNLRLRSYHVFCAWWEVMNVLKLARHQAGLEYDGLMHQNIVTCFCAWRDAVAASVHEKVTLARAVLHHWASCVHQSRTHLQVVDRMATRQRQQCMKRVLKMWHRVLIDARATADHMKMRREHRRLADFFATWCTAVSGGAAVGPYVGDLAAAVHMRKYRCRSVFRAWKCRASRSARTSKILIRQFERLAWRLQRSALLEWRSVTWKRRRGRFIIDRCHMYRQQQCLRAALQAWHEGVKGSTQHIHEQLQQSVRRRHVSVPAFN